MSTITASPISGLTDEQRDFRAAIRDFAERECGTREQRERSPTATRSPTTRRSTSSSAELGWLGVSIPEDYGGAGGGDGRPRASSSRRSMRGLVPIAGFGVSLIVAGAYERFGTEEQKQEILGGIAGGRVEAIAMSEPEAGSDVGALSCKAERQRRRLRGQRPEDLDLRRPPRRPHPARRPHRQLGLQARGPDDVLGPDRRRGLEIRGIETMGGKEVNDVFFTDCHVAAERVLGEEGNGWMQLMAGLNVERLILAATVLGHRAAGVRRRARLRQGAQAVRPADRLLPGAQAPHRRPRDRARVHPPAGLRRRPQGRRRPAHDAARARPRWRSSRPPRSPSTSRSRACR